MGADDDRAVLETGRLHAGAPFTIPVTLRVEVPPTATRIALWQGDPPVCIVEFAEAFQTGLAEEARALPSGRREGPTPPSRDRATAPGLNASELCSHLGEQGPCTGAGA